MSEDPYRSTSALCPDCRKGPMRAFSGRLICDDCTGMFLRLADLETSIGEVTGQPTKLALADGGAAPQLCPQCTNPMSASTLEVVGFFAVREPIARCAAHGLWLPTGRLAGIFARLNRRIHFGAAQGRAYGGVSGQGGSTYQMLRDRHKPTLPRPLAIDPYAGRRLACPACTTVLVFHGDRWTCDGCGGAFVETEALVSLVTDVTHQPWTMPAPAGTPGARKCPVCTELLTVEQLHGITLDRCAKHGVWFDPGELVSTLEHVAGVAVDQEPHGLAGWLQQLFGSRAG